MLWCLRFCCCVSSLRTITHGKAFLFPYCKTRWANFLFEPIPALITSCVSVCSWRWKRWWPPRPTWICSCTPSLSPPSSRPSSPSFCCTHTTTFTSLTRWSAGSTHRSRYHSHSYSAICSCFMLWNSKSSTFFCSFSWERCRWPCSELWSVSSVKTWCCSWCSGQSPQIHWAEDVLLFHLKDGFTRNYSYLVHSGVSKVFHSVIFFVRMWIECF